MKFTAVSLLLIGANAQSLTEVLAGAKGIDGFKSVVSKYPDIVAALGAAKDITIFVPKDGAKGIAALAAAVASPPSPGFVEATLTYHVVKGAIPAAKVPSKAFVETLLASGPYSSVTGGQKLQVGKEGRKVVLQGAAGSPAATVVAADIKFDGGYIHLIDSVLQAPTSAVATAKLAGLNSLVGALSAAGLAGAVEDAKDVTIFAPTDAAFAAIAGTVAKLSTAQVADVLKYHVVKGVAYSTDLKDGQTFETLLGKTVKISIAKSGVKVNGIKVIKPDVLVKQGVVHVIEGVIVPA